MKETKKKEIHDRVVTEFVGNIFGLSVSKGMPVFTRNMVNL